MFYSKKGVSIMSESPNPSNVSCSPKKLLTEKEVSRRFGISCSTLQKHRFKGIGIPYVKFGRLVRYDIDDLYEFMNQHKVICG